MRLLKLGKTTAILMALGLSTLSLADDKSLLDRAYQDEWKAKSRYEAVLTLFGSMRPFSMLTQAESRHLALLEESYRVKGLIAPRLLKLDQKTYQSAKDACTDSLLAEKANVALYDELLTETSDENLVHVFSILRDASLNRHIPALERCQSGCPMNNNTACPGLGRGPGKGRGQRASGA